MQRNLLHEILGFHRKLNDTNRVVTREQTGIKILLTELKTSTCNESLANGINHLQAILFTKTVKPVVDFL